MRTLTVERKTARGIHEFFLYDLLYRICVREFDGSQCSKSLAFDGGQRLYIHDMANAECSVCSRSDIAMLIV